MSTKVCLAKMGCTPKQPNKVIALGTNVGEKLYANSTEYATPPMTKILFSPYVATAAAAQAAAKNRGKQEIADRDAAVKALFAVLEDKFLSYVNGLYKGFREKLLLSGFPVTKDPSPRSIPETPVIRKIIPGPEPHSAKIILEKFTTPAKNYGVITYTLWRSDDPEMKEGTFTIVLETTNRHKLIAKGLTRGKETAFAVSARNSAGSSEQSGGVKFMPT